MRRHMRRLRIKIMRINYMMLEVRDEYTLLKGTHMREKTRGTKGLLRYIEDNPLEFKAYTGTTTENLLDAIEEWMTMRDEDRVRWDVRNKNIDIKYNHKK